jgi:branched-chain amino acid transport system substrate-binding protein
VSKRALVLLVLALATTLAVVAAAQSRPNAGKTINVGWVGDKSGPTVASQQPYRAGLESYIRMVNEAGGINGDKINLIEKDDQFNLAKGIELAKQLINDDKVPLITGLGNSAVILAILPDIAQAHVVAFGGQGSNKSMTDPFQPWVFEGNCNYADQADVALGYEMTHLKLKTLKGISVGIPAIAQISGQEWTDAVSAHVKALGGTPVTQAVPISVVNADLQAQAFQDAKVKFVLMHHSVPGGIAILKSLAKYNLDVPVAGPYGVAQPLVWTSSPYAVAKDYVGMNCVSPPLYVKSKKGKLAYTTGKKYGYSQTDITQLSYSLGWVQGQVIVQGLRNAKGNYTGDAIRAGLEKIRNLDTGDLSPKITLSANCHMAIRQARPYTYSYKTDAMLPVGTYARWAKFITNAQAAPGTCGKKG